MNWKAVERELGALIMTGEYYTPPKAFDPDKVSAAVWQEVMDEFFQNSFWSPVPNMLLYEVFSKDLPMSDKAQFMEMMLAKNPYAVGIENGFKNRYGRCDIEQAADGISIEFLTGKAQNGEQSLTGGTVRLMWKAWLPTVYTRPMRLILKLTVYWKNTQMYHG